MKRSFLLAILLLIVLFFIAVGYVIVVVYFKDNTQQLKSSRDQQVLLTQDPVVMTLPIQSLNQEQWFDLSNDYLTEYALQANGIADHYPKPVTPTSVRVDNTTLGQSVLVHWHIPKQQSYDGIEIYRDKELLTTVTTGSLTYLDTTVTDGTIYYYALRSFRKLGNDTIYSDRSDTVSVISSDSTAPAPPLWLTVIPVVDEPATLAINWELVSISDVTEQRVYRSLDPGAIGQLITTVAAEVNYVLDPTVLSGTTYYYAVTTVDAAGNESTKQLAVARYGNSTPFVADETQAVQLLSSQ